MNPTSTQTNPAGGRRLEETARHSMESATSKGREAMDTAKQAVSESARETAETARREAGAIGSHLRERGLAYLENQKHCLSSEVQAFADATRKAAQRLDEESDTHMAEYISRASDFLAATSRRINEKDLRSLTEDLERSARRHPEVVFGGLFVAGLAMTRFLKASKPRRRLRAAGRYGSPVYENEAVGRATPGSARSPRPPLAAQPTGLPTAQETRSQGTAPAANAPSFTSKPSVSPVESADETRRAHPST